MIRTLTGTITYVLSQGVIIDVQGVGYLVTVPTRLAPAIGSTVTVWTHHHVREQEQSLYGFASPSELAAFEQLLAVPSIGPKSALAILSTATTAELDRAIAVDDLSFFASVPGIGKKTAAKIIVELKGKLAVGGEGGSSELRSALEGLGYSLRDVEPLLRRLPEALVETPAQLSWLLRELGR